MKSHEKNMRLVGRGVSRNPCNALSKIFNFSGKQLGFYLWVLFGFLHRQASRFESRSFVEN